MSTTDMDRRRFLQLAGAGVAGVTMGSLPFVRGDGPTSAQTTGPRSLVCIFLAGGADSFNMVVPLGHDATDQDHGTYRSTRGSFAVPESDLLSIHDGAFGLHPRLDGLAGIAARGDLAVVNNVGPLTGPTTAADVAADRRLPQFLFAHDAQQKLWKTGRTNTAFGAGWGGSIQRAITADDSLGSLSPAFSIAGSSLWQAGAGTSYSRLSRTTQIERLLGYDASLRRWIPSSEGLAGVLDTALDVAGSSDNLMERAAGDAVRRSLFTTSALQEATASSEANEVGMDDVGGNKLGTQLRVVARLIKNRELLGMDRQVFFVQMGGWDTHRAQAEILPVLLEELDVAITSFDAALVDLGVTESVTTFTASDFGRTLTSNGDGTDHGWGGHAFVIGGAVKSGRYGTFPSYATSNNPDDISGGTGDFAGRLIPTTSVSQYGATLAKWMGLTGSQLASAFPDLEHFSVPDLGFL